MALNIKKIIKIAAPLLLFALYILYFHLARPVNSSYPGLEKGEVYISDESFYSGRDLFLAGEWEFYFGEILDSADFDAKEQRNYYNLPDFWLRDMNDESVNINGHGSYRVRVRFETPKETVTLNIPWVFGAYEVFANGKSVLRCGEIGLVPESETPDSRTQTAVIPLGGDSLELIIHISGQISGLSGLWHPVALGPDASISSYRTGQIAQDAVFIGCFLIMGFYHFAIFLLRRKDKATLVFSLLCFAAMLHQGTVSYGLLYHFLLKGSGFLAYDTYILSQDYAIALFGLFSYYLFGAKYGLGKKNIQLLLAVLAVKTVFELVHTYNYSFFAFILLYTGAGLCIVYVLRVLYLIHRKKEKNRFLYTYGVMYLFLAYGADILVDFGLSGAGVLFGSTAFVIFAFVETVILARIFTDFSYENERMLSHMEAMVEERTAELAEANERLRLMERTRSELISNVSHDLRTPVTAIKGYLELMVDEASGEADKIEYAESANVRADQLEQMIKDLFLLTRLTEKSVPMNAEPVDLSAALSACYRNYLPVAEQKGIELALNDPVGSITVSADRSFLDRILDNLAQNALYHARTRIELNVSDRNGAVLLSVADDGAGIDAESLPLVFDRFYKKRKDGAGLGLCIVKELVTAMGGEVSAHSTPNERTEFRVKLRTSPGG